MIDRRALQGPLDFEIEYMIKPPVPTYSVGIGGVLFA